MKSFWEIPFIVVDVETSGSHHLNNRITEIACVTTIGGEITNIYSSLINPHESIPYFISRMTGITNEMVFRAPELTDVMPVIEEIFNQKDAVFVAHNARFDWAFVSESFNLAGLNTPKIPRLCTLKLSRRLLPKRIKKNLGELSGYFNITVKNRHRASGDAVATAHVLNELLELSEYEHGIKTKDDVLHFQNKQIRNFKVPSLVYKRMESTLNTLPEEPGVYRFLDQTGNLLYIGKAKSLKKRVNSYFNKEIMTSKKIAEMIRLAHDIKFETTGSELSALLLESELLIRNKPPYNTTGKDSREHPLIKLTSQEEFPKIEITYKAMKDGADYFGPFKNISLAYDIIRNIDKKYKLRKCNGELHPGLDNSPCFYHQIKQCDAPCSLRMTKAEYADEVAKIKLILNGQSDGFITILEKKMYDFADKLQFEKAEKLKFQIKELKRLFDTKYSYDNTRKTNFAFINPISNREQLLEIFVIKSGALIHQETIGSKAPLQNLNKVIVELLYNGYSDNEEFDETDLNKQRIIQSYTYRRKDFGKYIYCEDKSKETFMDELKSAIRNFKFHESE